MRRAFIEALEAVRRDAPSSPITLLSPLAEGCDQLAADWALAWGGAHPLPDRSSRVRLVVPRPLPRPDYIQDFAPGSASRSRFEALESQADLAFDLPPGTPRNGRPLDRDDSGRVCNQQSEGRHDRDEHYRRLGLFVAQQSHLMVAFWDGVEPRRMGGTAEVVKFCRTGGLLEERDGGEFRAAPFRDHCPPLSRGDPTPVCVVPTPRESGDATARVAATPFTAAALQIARDVQCINRTIEAHSPPEGFRASPFRESHLIEHTSFAATCALFEALDGVASVAKARFLGCMKRFVACTAVAITLFQVFSSFGQTLVGESALAGYMLLLAAAWWVRRVARRDRLEWISVHARAQAEVLRIHLAMTLAGLREEVSDWVPAHREADVAPLRRLLCGSALGLLSMPDPLDASVRRRGLHDARSRWLEDQRGYWKREMRPGSRRSVARRSIETWDPRIRVTVFGIALGLALTVLVFRTIGTGIDQSIEEMVCTWGCLLAGASLASALGIGLWQRFSMDGEDLEGFRRMHRVFSTAAERLDECGGRLAGEQLDARCREYLRAAGREQFEDACDWYVRHRDRMPEVTAG